MKERPILFSGPMVRAILDGRKTMTRRVVNRQPKGDELVIENGSIVGWKDEGTRSHNASCFWAPCSAGRLISLKCPCGDPGDRLWVRETWCQKMDDGLIVYNAEGNLDPSCVWYKADGVDVRADDGYGGQKWRKDGSEASPWIPSIHMPSWASRITLEITGVKVERINDISGPDVVAEGIPSGNFVEFMNLWDSINAKRGYGSNVNPWVWVIEFRRVKK